MTAVDVVVAGAGPAGSAAAHALASAGAQVLLLERARFPRDKSCGDGVTAHAVDILTEMGVSFDAFGPQAVKTHGGLIGSPNGDAFLAQAPPHNGKPPECWVVPRMLLDERVAQSAVVAGAQLRQGAQVTGLVSRRGVVEGVEWSDGSGTNRTAAPIVIGADGAHSAVAKSLRVKTPPPRHMGYALRGYFADVRDLSGELEIYYFDAGLLPGYGWIFPTGPDTANVGVGIYSGELKRSQRKLRDILSAFVTSVPRVARQLQNARPIGKAIGWPLPVSSAHRRTTFDGAMLCGDAASLVDPLTGEGIYTALVSGRSAAHAAIAALKSGDTSSSALRGHDREWRALAGGYLSSGRLLKNLAKSPVLMNLIVRRARENGYYASRAIGYGLGTLDRRRALKSIILRALFNPSFFRS